MLVNIEITASIHLPLEKYPISNSGRLSSLTHTHAPTHSPVALDSRLRSCELEFEPHKRHCVVSLGKINPSFKFGTGRPVPT